MVELVDDHIRKAIGVDLGEVPFGERTNAGERVPPVARQLAIHVELAEGGIPPHLAEGGNGLLDELARAPLNNT